MFKTPKREAAGGGSAANNINNAINNTGHAQGSMRKTGDAKSAKAVRRDAEKDNSKVRGGLRHRIIWSAVRPPIRLYMWLKFRFRTETLKTDEPTIILCNHTTEKDMLMCWCAFPKQMYFVAGEHLSTRKSYPKLDYLLHMILMYKGDFDLAAVKEIVRRLRAGHNILLFPEGSRSFNGETEHLPESIGKLCRMGKCGIITYRTSGGYFAEPRWAYSVRQGHLEGHIIRHLTSSEVKSMSTSELTKLINEDLYENAYDRQRKEMRPYRGKRLAEGLENYLVICPNCGAYDSIITKDDKFRCKICGMNGIYDVYGFLKGDHVPYDNVCDWGKWVKEQFRQDLIDKWNLKETAGIEFGDERLFSDTDGESVKTPQPSDTDGESEKTHHLSDADRESGKMPLFSDSNVKFYEIMPDHVRINQPADSIRCYFDRLIVGAQEFEYAKITGMSMLYYGKTLLFTYRGRHFGVTGESFHAVRYQYTWDFYQEVVRIL